MVEEELGPTAVIPQLATKWLGQHYHYVESVGSTNDEMKKWLADRKLPSGTVLLTNYQTQGKGRLNRRWLAPAGTSLLFSVFFHLDWPVEQAQWLTMIATTAAVEAITAVTGLPSHIKWPNDLMLWHDGAWRKTAGVLLEADFDGNGRLRSAILGMGINVNILADHLPDAPTPPTSLHIAAGKPISRRELLIAVLANMETGYETAVNGQSPQPRWNNLLLTLNQVVQVTNAGNGDTIGDTIGATIIGIAEATDAWGHLLVRDETGKLHTITAGDVTLRPNQ